MSLLDCANCRLPLTRQALEGRYGRSVEIDVCGGCQGIWFDDMESLQLSPRATLELFRLIHQTQSGPRRPLGHQLRCPRCRLSLSLCTDQQRSTRFHYHRCARCRGRFITFFHFLRARNFVRNLTPRELANLKAHVIQVNCSNCGAPLHLDRSDACEYCRAPVSILDPDQMKATIAELEEADERRRHVDPALPLTLMLERLKTERLFLEAGQVTVPGLGTAGSPLAAGGGLVEAGVSLFLNWWPR